MTEVEIDINVLSIALGLFFGLLTIALAIRGTKIGERLKNIEVHTAGISKIGDKISNMDERTSNMWDLIHRHFFREGTVSRKSKNLGKIKVTAEPRENNTDYLIEVEKPVLSGGLIEKISKESKLKQKEIEFFGEETSHLAISPRKVMFRLPSTDPKTCTKFMSFLLKWLDSTYWKSLARVEDFEKPIQIGE
jgi:hypothetical protein